MNLFESSHIRIICKLQAGSILATSLVVKSLQKSGRLFSVSFNAFINEDILKDISKEPFESFIFMGFGRGFKKEIKELFSEYLVFEEGESEKDENFLIGDLGLSIGRYVEAEDKIMGMIAYSFGRKDYDKEKEEFIETLRACCKQGEGSVALGMCLGDEESKKKALALHTDQKIKVKEGIDWILSSRNSPQIVERSAFMTIDGRDKIDASIIGAVVGEIAKDVKKIILGLARYGNGYSKASLYSSNGPEFMEERMKKLKVGEYGGTSKAATAVFPSAYEGDFLAISMEILEKRSIEEKI